MLSLEVWEEVNELYLWSGGAEARQLYRENREQFYRRVRKATQLILGLVRSTMLHDTPMSFLWMGAMLERVGQTARILDMHHHTMTLEPALEPTREAHQIVEVAVWLSLLRACSGYEAFVKRCRGRVTAQAVVSFLVFDSQFPRSLRYCLRSARKILQEIWPAAVTAGNRDQAVTTAMVRSFRASDPRHGSSISAPGWTDAPARSISPAFTRSSPTSSTRSPRSARASLRRSRDRNTRRSPPRASRTLNSQRFREENDRSRNACGALPGIYGAAERAKWRRQYRWAASFTGSTGTMARFGG